MLLKRLRWQGNIAGLIVLSFPFVMFICSLQMYISYRVVLNNSRPAYSKWFFKNKTLVDELTGLSQELISKENVFWIGNSGWSSFIFGIKYPDSDYLFSSVDIPTNFDSKKLIIAEDKAKVEHLDLPFQFGHQPTVFKVLDPNDYAFCERANSLIRKVGFHNVKLYPEENLVQYQIYDFIGWDGGRYYIYYYSPQGSLPNDLKYDRKLNDNWYYCIRPRFK
ncbi:MAG: hypothetical protein ACYTDW_17255 [Planctomycetota bacterium]|jgi:hypothetical protein